MNRVRPLGIGILVAFVLAIVVGFSSCETINPGHVGIVVPLSGTGKGSEFRIVTQGREFINPITTTIIEYPTFVQTAQWARTAESNEEIAFNSSEGMTITADVSLSYQIIPDRVGRFYAKYRKDDLSLFTDGQLRNIARDAFNAIGAQYRVEQIYGERKTEFLRKVRDLVDQQVAPDGIKVEQFGFLAAPRLPESVLSALNAKITATQQAQKAENELRVAEAEAAKTVATAEGAARARIAEAEGEAKANAVLTASITPQLLELKRIEVQQKWNGVLPTVQAGNGGLMLQMPQP